MQQCVYGVSGGQPATRACTPRCGLFHFGYLVFILQSPGWLTRVCFSGMRVMYRARVMPAGLISFVALCHIECCSIVCLRCSLIAIVSPCSLTSPLKRCRNIVFPCWIEWNLAPVPGTLMVWTRANRTKRQKYLLSKMSLKFAASDQLFVDV